MICTFRDKVGVETYIEGVGTVTMYGDIVNYEYHRKRVQLPNGDIVVGDYFYSNLNAINSVINRVIRKLKPNNNVNLQKNKIQTRYKI